ncbi:unnamed protein product [Rhizophagus irregularis]|uniref:Uncharacterized protein n=1 Tax=Rhizophagus irregularis TaxID=588596 RepID=A0A916DXR0_9GLOM|nr:unnamed protein product [Rhizophagus irregularis]
MFNMITSITSSLVYRFPGQGNDIVNDKDLQRKGVARNARNLNFELESSKEGFKTIRQDKWDEIVKKP